MVDLDKLLDELPASTDNLEISDNASQWLYQLQVAIEYLLKNDFERLLQIAYRLDISEKKFDSAFCHVSIPKTAEELAYLFYERQIQKINFRNNYK